MKTNYGGSDTPAQLSNGAYYASTLFDRHDVPPRAERSRLVTEVLGLEYRAAHRRVRGEIPWTFEELAKLAAHYGETLDEVFQAACAKVTESGTFIAGSLRLACKFQIGVEIKNTESLDDLVVQRQNNAWVVIPNTGSTAPPYFSVKQVWLDTQTPSSPRIAVLDDESDLTESVCTYLRQTGCRADPFHTVKSLEQAAASGHYDAYLLDWLIGQDNVAALITTLRQSDTRSVIAVLTGQAEAGSRITADIAQALSNYDVEFFQKPMPLAILSTKLMRLLEAAKVRRQAQ
jgi:CheY-like chemotaxis protein